MIKFFQWKTLLLIFTALLGFSVGFHIYLFLNFKKQAENVALPASSEVKGIQSRNIEEAAGYLQEKEAVFRQTLEKTPFIFDPS